MHCQRSLYCFCCLASVTFAAPSAPPMSMRRLLSPDSGASHPVVVTLAAPSACLSRVFIAARRLPRHQRHCRRTVSNVDVDAPLALRSLLRIVTGRHHSCRAVHSIFIAAARLLRRQRHCRRTAVSNADVDAPLTLRSLLCILITRRHHSCRAVNSASADCLLLVAGAACLPCYCVK